MLWVWILEPRKKRIQQFNLQVQFSSFNLKLTFVRTVKLENKLKSVYPVIINLTDGGNDTPKRMQKQDLYLDHKDKGTKKYINSYDIGSILWSYYSQSDIQCWWSWIIYDNKRSPKQVCICIWLCNRSTVDWMPRGLWLYRYITGTCSQLIPTGTFTFR